MAKPSLVTYLSLLPKAVPSGQVLVHNHVRTSLVHNHVRKSCRLAMRGFRAWLQAPDREKLAQCDCGWAPDLGPHYRVASAMRNQSDVHPQES